MTPYLANGKIIGLPDSGSSGEQFTELSLMC